MSQILGRELGGHDARFNLLLKLVKAAAERAVRCGHGGQHWGQAGTENAVVSAREEERGPQAEFGNPVAVGTRNALDHALKMEPSQLIGHAPWADWLGRLTQERSPVLTQIVIRKAGWQQGEQQQSVPKGLNLGIGEMQGRSPLSSHLAGTVHLLEDFFGQDAIMADPPIGLEADLPQAGQVVDSLADIEIWGAVDRGLGSQGSAFFVVLLDARSLIVDVQGRNHAIGNHPGSEQSGRTFGDPAVEDPLHLLGPADVQVFPNHFFEEDATGQWSVENLGEGKFDLENGELITIPGLTVARGERVRQETKPLA